MKIRPKVFGMMKNTITFSGLAPEVCAASIKSSGMISCTVDSATRAMGGTRMTAIGMMMLDRPEPRTEDSAMARCV